VRAGTAFLLTMLGAAGAVLSEVVLHNQRPMVRLLGAGVMFTLPWGIHAAARHPLCSVLWITDTHGSALANQPLVAAMIQETGISRVIHSGDVADAPDLWSPWWDTGFREVRDRWTVDAASGNHDYEDDANRAEFTRRFELLPRAVTCGNVEFFLLPWGADRADADWAHGRARASQASWKVLVVHQPLWGVDGSGSRLRGMLLPTLGYINLVLAGHQHVAQDSLHDVAGHTVRQIIDVSGPKKYTCPDGAVGCIENQTAYWRLDFYADEIVATRKVIS